MRKFPRILYFINGTLPSADAHAAVAGLGPNVAFRNVKFISESGSLEQCDGVAGEVPAAYAEKFPSAEDALKAYSEAVEADMKEAAARKKKREASEKKAEADAKKNPSTETKKGEEPKAPVNSNKPDPNNNANRPSWKPNS